MEPNRQPATEVVSQPGDSVIDQIKFQEVRLSKRQVEVEQKDPYAYMLDIDRYMIGKPADKQTWELLDEMAARRQKTAKHLIWIYAAKLLFPILFI